MQLLEEELNPQFDVHPTCAGAHQFMNLVNWEKYNGKWSMNKV